MCRSEKKHSFEGALGATHQISSHGAACPCVMKLKIRKPQIKMLNFVIMQILCKLCKSNIGRKESSY